MAAKKLAVTGTHSVGKSTFVYQLALMHKKQGENVHVIQERVRFSPFPINRDMSIDTCIWACCNQISKELEAAQRGFSVLICDRTPLDTFAYAAYNGLYRLEDLEKFALNWLNTYDQIFHVRPDLNHTPHDDGVRDTDLQFIRSVDEILFELLSQHPKKITQITTSQIFGDTR